MFFSFDCFHPVLILWMFCPPEHRRALSCAMVATSDHAERGEVKAAAPRFPVVSTAPAGCPVDYVGEGHLIFPQLVGIAVER